MRAPLAYVIRKNIIVRTYGDYLKNTTDDNKSIARMLHLPPNKNRLHNEQSVKLVKECTAEYKTDNRSVHDILDQICKDIDLYPHVKKHKSKKDGRRAIYDIHLRW